MSKIKKKKNTCVFFVNKLIKNKLIILKYYFGVNFVRWGYTRCTDNIKQNLDTLFSRL